MAKYNFKVYLRDGNSIKMFPSVLDDKKSELSDMDIFVYKCGFDFDLKKLLACELGIGISEIDSVKIIQNKSGREFSVISNNPYLTSILSSLKRKKINNYQSYEMDTIVVPKDNQNYIEMKDYLFKNIELDYQKFLKEVYKYDNEFSKLLYRYGMLLKHVTNSLEDLRDIQELKDKIETGLSIYKNYRGLCKSRYEYEKYPFYSKKSNTNVTVETKICYSNPEYKEKEVTQEDINGLNQFVNDFGEEKEEFLDNEEIESGQYYEKRR